jgi:hypothetical protein
MGLMIARAAAAAAMVGLLAGSAHSQPAKQDWTVYLRRVGPLVIGASVDDVRRVLADPDALLVQALRQRRELPPEPDDSACAYLATRRTPDQIGLMFSRGRLVRADVHAPGIRTAAGAQVGDTEARIRDLYGSRITVRPHHYPPAGAHYLMFTAIEPADRGFQMLFETDGSVVTRFRTGTVDAVGQVEGCA